MKSELIQLIETKSPGAIPLYLVIRGSHAYGTNTPTSDFDYTGVFVQSLDSLLGHTSVDQINDDKCDIVIYELARFLELLAKNNPNILELLNTPQDCVIYKHPLFDKILDNSDFFLTKMCANTFGGYAKEQISKAKGQNKKQNWEQDKVTRKTPIDFCFFFNREKSIPLIDYLESSNLDQKFAGLSKTPHSKDTYALFYDYNSASVYHRFPITRQELSTEKSSELKKSFTNFLDKNPDYKYSEMSFKGIAFENSNDVRLSSIPKNCPSNYFIGHISYNKDGYTQHCKDFKSYETWLEKRNSQRWIDVESHGQKIDGKNILHLVRLLKMSKEIAEGRGIIVRRPDAEELLKIRKGEVDLDSIIEWGNKEIIEIDSIFKNSNLPDSVDKLFIERLLIEIRSKVYFKKST